jgi:hypothetical protein
MSGPETRFVVCQGCGGDGGWNYFTGRYRIRDGSADEAWVPCPYCREAGEEEVEVFPITLEDFAEAFGP